VIKSLKPAIVSLTHSYATKFSELPSYGGDRSSDASQGKRRILYLRSQLELGTFFSPQWATVEFNGKLLRINGQHSSKMLAESSHLVRMFPKWVTVNRFRCDTEHDIAALFNCFDHTASVRTASDKMGAHKWVQKELRDVSIGPARFAVSGVACWLNLVEGVKVTTQDEMIRLVHQYPEFVKWASQFMGIARMKTRGTVAAMYSTWLTDPDMAFDFWTSVNEEDGESRYSGPRVLSSFLRDNTTVKAGTKRANSRAFYCKSIMAANAWDSEAETRLRYSPKSPVSTLKWRTK
jgi:hypothetical protein